MTGNETIAAIATGAGGGIGIVRISGPDALAVGTRVFRGRGGRSLEAATPLTMLLGTVADPRSGEPIDEAFAVHMRAGRSYSGEPTVEIQCHGGRAALDAVLRAALDAGARPAAPGEFTKRAFLSGRIDLSQAEAVAELIAAPTDGERRTALSRLQGSLGERVRSLRDRLLDQIAAAEVLLDHGDEEPDGLEPDSPAIVVLAGELRALVAAGESRERRPRGPTVVIAGRVNSGKSSIFNVLCNQERSIVSSVPGTTRDYVAEQAVINGSQVNLVDTAGLRDSVDPIEREGIRRSRAQILESDILVLVLDGAAPPHGDDLQLLDDFRERRPIVVLSKSDLPGRVDLAALQGRYPELEILPLSTRCPRGCLNLARALAGRCREPEVGGGESAPNLRQRDALVNAAAALEEFTSLIASGAPTDLAVAQLRGALSALGEITGESAGEAVIDRIFSRFCIGK